MEVFGVSRDMIMKYVSEHGMPKAGRGTYELLDCFNWYSNRLKLAADGGENGDIAEEKLKLVRAQRQRVELENKKKRSELLEAEFVGTVYNKAATTYASQLDGLGARLASVVAGMDDPGEIQRVIFNECRAIRESTAAEFVGLAYEYDGGGDIAAAPVKKRRRVGGRKQNTAKRKPGTRAVAH